MDLSDPVQMVNMSIRSASDVITDLNQTLTGETVSLHQILEAFHERGFGFLLLIFAFPMGIPLPVPPGVNLILATPLIFLTVQQAMGRHTVWMPQKIRHKGISRKKFDGMVRAALPLLKKLEILSKPRLGFITQGLFSNIIGVLGFIMTLAVFVPLPLTNTVPSMGIALMALGVIMRDGLAVITGAVVGIGWMMMLGLIVLFLGTEGIDMIKQTIISFF